MSYVAGGTVAVAVPVAVGVGAVFVDAVRVGCVGKDSASRGCLLSEETEDVMVETQT